MKWLLYGAVLTIFCGLLVGCGGGSEEGTASREARLRVSIAWGERSRSITGPSSALSATITAIKARRDGKDMTFTVDRPDGAEAQTVEYQSPDPITTGRHTVQVRFHADRNGTGDVVGLASDNVEIATDGSGLSNLSTVGTVAAVLVPDGQRVPEGGTSAMAVRVVGTNGQWIAVAPDAVFWTVVEGADLVTFTNGVARGLRHGRARVLATVDGKASVPANVDVVVAPTARLIPLLPGADPVYSPNEALAVSADGVWVVGSCNVSSLRRAYRWNRIGVSERNTDMVPEDLGVLPGYTESVAYGVSADGRFVVGACYKGYENGKPFIWREGSGMQAVPDLPDDARISEALAVSEDGSTVVGWYQNDDQDVLGFQWSGSYGLISLDDVQDPRHRDRIWAKAVAVNANGSKVLLSAAYTVDDEGKFLTMPVMVRTKESYELLCDVNGANPDTEATWMNRDATVVTGHTSISKHKPSFPTRWTPASGWVHLHPLVLTAPLCGSADGSIIAGGAANPGEGFIWSVTEGYQNLNNILGRYGIADDLEGNAPSAIHGVSDDGQVFVGTAGTSPFRACVITLPR